MSAIPGIYQAIIGHSPKNHKLEQRLFTTIMLLGSITGLFAFTSAFILGLNLPAQIVTCSVWILFAVLWQLARRGAAYSQLVYPLTFILVAILSLEWMLNAGSHGGAILYLLICPVTFLIFSKGIGRIITSILYLGVVAALFALERTYPGLLTQYASPQSRMIDVGVSFFLCVMVSSAFILIIHNAYIQAMKKLDGEKLASELRFIETANMLPLVICETDLKFVITFINKVGFDLLGYSPGEMAGSTTVLGMIHTEDRVRASADLYRNLRGERSSVEEYRIVRKDGKIVWVLLQSDIVLKENIISGLRMCMLDITEKKQLEQQYHQSQKMESVGFLAGGMAHDFNNILSMITGYASLIQVHYGQTDAKLFRQVGSILTATERAADLVKNLLAFSRRGNIKVAPFDMHALIGEVESLLSRSIDKRISIIKNLSASNPIIEGDQALLQSALLNLAINARDAMPNGGTLTFSTRQAVLTGQQADLQEVSAPPGTYLAITVSDTGVGMDDATKVHLFEPFFTTKEPGKGTGLGLASVFGTVNRHNGYLDIKSTKNIGTEITLYLLSTSESVVAISTDASQKAPSNQLRILVIDDEESICEFIREYLLSQQYPTTTFIDAQSAVAWYKNNYQSVDCIILDMNMPRLSGQECFAQLRKINPDAKGLFITGFAAGDTAIITDTPGIRGRLMKPFSFESLTKAIHRAVTE